MAGLDDFNAALRKRETEGMFTTPPSTGVSTPLPSGPPRHELDNFNDRLRGIEMPTPTPETPSPSERPLYFCQEKTS
jgi:hypothetical protein